MGAVKRHVLVTGGSKGIGRAIAGAFARNGFMVSVLGRDVSSLDAAISAGDAHCAVVADVTNPKAVREAVARAERQAPIDILVNNAGAVETGPFSRLDDDAFERQLALNLMGTVRMTRAILPGMTERGFGRVINIASTAGLKAYPYVSAYVTAKHAVIGFTRALALEMAKSGVTVNAICPGYTDTDLVRESVARISAKGGGAVEDVLAKLTAANPQGRLVRPTEVACVAAWLASDEAASITGQAIPVDGGETVS
ncbi:MAG: SDR family oxidoreductase [Hyphomicrobiales bacterium]|nr:SDR family oxidoreductase [Hyphomicrobiales bacterium]